MEDEDLSRMSLTEVSEAIAMRNVSSEEVVRNSLSQLEKHESRILFYEFHTSFLTICDLFRPKSPSLILEE